MIVQTFSLDNLLNGDEEGVPDPLADYRKLSYRDQLEDLQRKHHDRERELVSQIFLKILYIQSRILESAIFLMILQMQGRRCSPILIKKNRLSSLSCISI